MKKTDTLMKIVAALVFCAMTAYLAVYVVNRFIDPVQTSLTVTATISDTSPVSGLVVRNELLIKSDAQYINVTASDGDKIAAGGAVAVAYGSEQALERASQIGVLAREIQDVESSLSDTGSGSLTAKDRESSVYEALTGISAAVRNGELAGVDTEESALEGLLFSTGSEDATEEYLQQLETEYDQLLATSSGDTEEITVAQSGMFSTVVDGFEGVTPEYIEDLYPDELREIISADRVVEQNVIGKLVTSYYWYYAAIVSREDASRLVAGMTVQLSFGRYYDGSLTAKVEYIGRARGDEQIVLFSLDKGFSNMLAVRAVSADIVYSEYTGLRVPLKGLYRYYACYVSEEDGSRLAEGGTVTLTLGDSSYEATVSELGDAQRYGELPIGVESGSEEDTRPSRRLAVFCWLWDGEDAPDLSGGGGTVSLPDDDGGGDISVTSYYSYDPEDETDRLCVFTMTGLQAERKKVTLIYAGEEYALVSSDGDDALREGNEIIVRANGLYNGKVFR